MKGLLVVAGLATAVAVVSGVLLLSAPRGPGGDSSPVPGPGAAAARAPGAGPGGGDPADPGVDVERRLRALELRIEELQGQVLMAVSGGGGPSSARIDGVAGALPGVAGEDGAEGAGTADGDAGDGGDGSDGGNAEGKGAREEVLRALAEARARTGELRRERDLAVRLDMMAVSMDLQPAEKDRMEEILRAHLEKVEETGARARELLKDSPLGLSPGDRAALDQAVRDRRKLDRETEQTILSLVGGERWKKFHATIKDQAEKERTLRRLGQPW